MMQRDTAVQKILSIGVAAFNMEEYLEECLSSLMIDKDMDAIEVLVIDDGSRDRTLEIAQRWAEKYPQTFSVTSLEENCGYGKAVQKSIDLAGGKYFMVVDADDRVNSATMSGFVNYLRNCGADLVLCDRIICLDDLKKTSWLEIKEGNYAFNKTLPMADAAHALWDYSIHHMIVQTGILHRIDIRLDKGFYTDIELTWLPLPHIRTVAVTDRCIKTYRRREGQSTTEVNCYNHRNDMEMVLLRLVRSLEDSRRLSLPPEQVRLMERKIQGAAAMYFRWMLNVPFTVAAFGLGGELRDFYVKLKPVFNKMEKPAFGVLPAILIKLNFRCFLLLRLAQRNIFSPSGFIYFLVNRILPAGTKRRGIVKNICRKRKITG